MILSSEFNNENMRTIPINMTEWQKKRLAEQYFFLWMLSSIKFSIKWKDWLISSSKKSCFLQVNRIVSIKAFSAFKRLSSLAGETVYGIPPAAFITCSYLAIRCMLQVQKHILQRPELDSWKRDPKVCQLFSNVTWISMLWYIAVRT